MNVLWQLFRQNTSAEVWNHEELLDQAIHVTGTAEVAETDVARGAAHSMLSTVWIDKAVEEVFNLLVIGDLDRFLDLLMEHEQVCQQFHVVGRLTYAESVK